MQVAAEQDGRLRQSAQENTRSIFHDPEKIVGNAQSAIAMKVLYAPLVDLINETRPIIGVALVSLVSKMVSTMVLQNGRGADLPLEMPAGYKPKSMDMSLKWGEVFPLTVQDFQQISSALSNLASGNIMSRETVLRKLSKYPWVSIDDIEDEVKKVNTQKEFNTFFGGG